MPNEASAVSENRRTNAACVPLVLFSLTVFGSLFFLVTTSLKPQNEYIVNKVGLPVQPTLANFSEVLSRTLFLRWLLNSVIITAFALMIAFVVAVLLSYGFSSTEFKFKKFAFSVVSSLMVVPPIVLITPIYEMLANLRWINTYHGTVSADVSWIVPFWTFFLTRFFMAINKSVLDSARLDGAGDLTLLGRIILPLSKAPLMTLATVSTLWVWNDLLISLLFLQKDSLRTLMVGLTVFKGMYTTNVPATFAGLIIATLPMVLFYVFGQRFFIKSVISGAVKG
jgi:ABC-type glycerol-3-phosphate transport system permease component